MSKNANVDESNAPTVESLNEAVDINPVQFGYDDYDFRPVPVDSNLEIIEEEEVAVDPKDSSAVEPADSLTSETTTGDDSKQTQESTAPVEKDSTLPKENEAGTLPF